MQKIQACNLPKLALNMTETAKIYLITNLVRTFYFFPFIVPFIFTYLRNRILLQFIYQKLGQIIIKFPLHWLWIYSIILHD